MLQNTVTNFMLTTANEFVDSSALYDTMMKLFKKQEATNIASLKRLYSNCSMEKLLQHLEIEDHLRIDFKTAVEGDVQAIFQSMQAALQESSELSILLCQISLPDAEVTLRD